jgi:hypothetical protein
MAKLLKIDPWNLLHRIQLICIVHLWVDYEPKILLPIIMLHMIPKAILHSLIRNKLFSFPQASLNKHTQNPKQRMYYF